MRNQVQLQSMSQQVYDSDGLKENSVNDSGFRLLEGSRKNQAMIESSRRKTRECKDLNPFVLRSQQVKKVPIHKKQAQNKKVNKQKDQTQKMDEHKIPLEQLCYRLGSSLQKGLTNQMAIKRNLEEGDNKLPQKKPLPRWVKFLQQITNWFAIMLWVGSILCILIYIIQPAGNLSNLYFAFVLIFIIILTGTFTYAQKSKSQQVVSGFKNMLPSVVKALRDGKLTQMPAQKLVRGDIVEVICGEKIPADIRIIASTQMKIDNSSITGDVQPLLRSTECTHPEQPLESKNLAFCGTLCKQGRGRGIVINIGQNTIMGKIADLNVPPDIPKSYLRAELDRFILIIAVISISLGIILFLIAFFVVKYSVIECLVFGIGILVANVPEGLLIYITLSLVITAKKLFKKKVLIKNLDVIQNLGSISCICCDKTGVLTQNRMIVKNLWFDESIKKAHNKQIQGDNFQYEYKVNDPSFKILHHAALICSEAVFDVNQQEVKAPGFKYVNASVIGDSSQTALIKYYQPIEEITKTRSLYKFGKCQDGSDSKMPFNYSNKYSLSIVHQEGPNYHWVVYVKGVPEVIWKFCERILFKGKYKAIDEQQKKKFENTYLHFTKNGQRVLGFAMLPLNKEQYGPDFTFITSKPGLFNFSIKNFIFIGLISLIDPPKQNTSFAIKKCQTAGIKVVMITGDQIKTAAAIAKEIGVITLKSNQDLKDEGYSDEEALAKANAIIINEKMIDNAFKQGEQIGKQTLASWVKKPQICFARMTPSQKLNIVLACQNAGYIVGITGDGVGDSPAVKQGDIGIALGISGSDITKQACDLIILNDDFNSIVDAIQEGRKAFDNLKKIIVYLLTSNVAQIWPFVGLVVLQIPLPLSNIFILCICVGTDIYPALSLAYQEAEINVMTRKPRKLTDQLISTRLLIHAYGQMGLITTAGGFFTYFTIMSLYGFDFNVIFNLLSKPCAVPNGDNLYNIPYLYDPLNSTFNAPLAANCNNQMFQIGYPSWISDVNSAVDLRGLYVVCNTETGGYNQLFEPNFYNNPTLNTISPITGQQVAFTTESIFYAQSGYFVTVVMIQWSNLFACKSRKNSFIYSALNFHMFGGIFFETIFFIFLLYVPGVNKIFGGRPLQFFLLGVPGLGFSMLLLLWEQSRKFLINLNTNNGRPNWWQRNLLW